LEFFVEVLQVITFDTVHESSPRSSRLQQGSVRCPPSPVPTFKVQFGAFLLNIAHLC
jgi:hypothetical protein